MAAARGKVPRPEDEQQIKAADTDASDAGATDEQAQRPQPKPSIANVAPTLASAVVQVRGAPNGPLLAMPMVGLGTFRAKGAALVEAVRYAIAECGVRLIDTAEGYNNAPAVAEGIKKSGIPRSELFVVSKVGKESMTAAGVAACATSHAALFGGYVDLMLLHWPGNANSNPESKGHAKARAEAWRGLQRQLVPETTDAPPLVKSIGVSNFTQKHLEALIAEPGVTMVPSVNQIEVHPFHVQRPLRDFCQTRGIVVQGYTTLGRCTEPPRCLYGHWEPDLPRLVRDETVKAIAQEVGRSCEQVLLRWSLQEGVGVIPKSLTPAHIKANITLFDFELPVDAMARLCALDRRGELVYAYRPEKVPV